MFHTGKNVLLFASLATSALLFGCGGGSSSDSGSSAPYAYYIDAAVSGIHYVCGTHEGDTDADGKFYFQEGSTCTFSLADITLKSLETEGLDSGSEVQETDATIARILQSLDTDSDDDTITISEETIAALATAYSEASEDDDSGDDSYASLTTLLEIATEVVEDAGGTMVSEEDAIDHLLSNALAGATLYDVGFNDGEILYQTLKFDADLSSVIWTNILDSEDAGTATINSLEDSVLSVSSDEDMEFNLELVENGSSFYIKMTEILADSSTETAEVQYLFPTMAAAKSLLAQEILTGNTVYAVNVTETSMESWQFNDDLTTGTWTDTDGESGTDTIEYEDLILYATDEEGTATITFSDITEDYLTATADSGSETTSLRIYLSESLATTYLASLNSDDSSDDTSPDDSDDDSSSDDGTTDDSSDTSTTIAFTTGLIADQTWYTEDFYQIVFDSEQGTVTSTSLFDADDEDIDYYYLNDGALLVNDGVDFGGMTITLLNAGTGYYTAQLDSEDGTETLNFYTSKDAFEASFSTVGSTKTDTSDDSLNQSNSGFELSTLTVEEVENDTTQLQITLTAEGDILSALTGDAASGDSYQNILWVDINDTIEFGYNAAGEFWCDNSDADEEGYTTYESCSYNFDGTNLVITIDASDIPTNDSDYLLVQAEIAEEATDGTDAENSYDTMAFSASWSYESTDSDADTSVDYSVAAGTYVAIEEDDDGNLLSIMAISLLDDGTYFAGQVEGPYTSDVGEYGGSTEIEYEQCVGFESTTYSLSEVTEPQDFMYEFYDDGFDEADKISDSTVTLYDFIGGGSDTGHHDEFTQETDNGPLYAEVCGLADNIGSSDFQTAFDALKESTADHKENIFNFAFYTEGNTLYAYSSEVTGELDDYDTTDDDGVNIEQYTPIAYKQVATTDYPLAGTWFVDNTDEPVTIVFTDSGYYVLMEAAAVDDGAGPAGIEVGQYVYSETAGTLTVAAVPDATADDYDAYGTTYGFDYNGDYGLSDFFDDALSVSISGDEMTLTLPGEGDVTLIRQD